VPFAEKKSGLSKVIQINLDIKNRDYNPFRNKEDTKKPLIQ
jgi:hypothetical protein